MNPARQPPTDTVTAIVDIWHCGSASASDNYTPPPPRKRHNTYERRRLLSHWYTNTSAIGFVLLLSFFVLLLLLLLLSLELLLWMQKRLELTSATQQQWAERESIYHVLQNQVHFKCNISIPYQRYNPHKNCWIYTFASLESWSQTCVALEYFYILRLPKVSF